MCPILSHGRFFSGIQRALRGLSVLDFQSESTCFAAVYRTTKQSFMSKKICDKTLETDKLIQKHQSGQLIVYWVHII